MKIHMRMQSEDLELREDTVISALINGGKEHKVVADEGTREDYKVKKKV